MSFLISQIREQKILEMEVEIDAFLEENNISESAMIHTAIFDKEVFVEEKEVREYLKDKFYFDITITEDEKSFTAQLVSTMQVDMDTEIEIELRRGVTVKAADLLPVPSFDEMRFNDKGEVNLSHKFGTIDLSEGIPFIIEIARVAEGEHPSYGKLKITQEHLESMELNYKSNVTGVDLAVNEDHRKNEAFGWFKDVFLSFDKQTLFGQVKWNSKGNQALSEKEYRYFSPEFRFNYIHPHSGEEHGPTLLGGALTNYPFLKMEAITQLNSKSEKGESTVTTKTIELSVHDEKVVELSGKISTLQTSFDNEKEKNVELSNKVTELEKKIEDGTKKAAHEKLFTAGKINKAQLVALNEGKSHLEVLALSEQMNLDGKGTDETPKGEEIALSEGEKSLASQLGLTDEEFNAVNK
jgi:hypothetical protein